MDQRTSTALNWLLGSDEPAIRLLARRELLGERTGDDAGRVLSGHAVTALLSGQDADGGFGVHPYRKWTGAHWRLVSLVELAIEPLEPRAVAAADQVLRWLTGTNRHVVEVGGLTRRCASKGGNALAGCCRLGLAAAAPRSTSRCRPRGRSTSMGRPRARPRHCMRPRGPARSSSSIVCSAACERAR